ncbi:hypothetical protein ACIQK6_38225 [Streptomyces sp. NPDC091682]|uniref:hypothetical protein n=1 Tax=Streptomyces sp. NPDC091682 TaxID=3366005 RepID=UPI0038295038
MATRDEWPEDKLQQLSEIVGDEEYLYKVKMARLVVQEYGLPKGPVVDLLRSSGIDEAVIEEVSSKLVPYRYT